MQKTMKYFCCNIKQNRQFFEKLIFKKVVSFSPQRCLTADEGLNLLILGLSSSMMVDFFIFIVFKCSQKLQRLSVWTFVLKTGIFACFFLQCFDAESELKQHFFISIYWNISNSKTQILSYCFPNLGIKISFIQVKTNMKFITQMKRGWIRSTVF